MWVIKARIQNGSCMVFNVRWSFHALWMTKIMPIPTLNTLAYLTQTQLQGHPPLDVRAWELKSGAFCEESFSSYKEYTI